MDNKRNDDFRVALNTWRGTNPLRVYLNEKGISQVDAATKFNVSRYTVIMWLQGTSNPSPENMQAIANFMGFPLVNLRTAWAKWEGKKP